MQSNSRALLREIELAGSCTHPIRLSGEMVNLITGEIDRRSLRVACKDRRAQICRACSYLYQADAWILVAAGLAGGKGVPESVGSHPRLFVTLTAPSFGLVHTRFGDGKPCSSRQGNCPHGVTRQCQERHEIDGVILGTPLCSSCFDYEGAVLWNAHASRLWNRTVEQVRREIAIRQGLTLTQFRHEARVAYLKVAEFQRRGLVHFHGVLRADGAAAEVTPPPEWLNVELLASSFEATILEFHIVSVLGEPLHWGVQFNITDVSTLDRHHRRIASYFAKYATKSTSDSLALARRFHSRREIEHLQLDPHLKRMAVVAWDLSQRPILEFLHTREHAHAFGFTGQLITKSRNYSTTFKDLRSSRSEHMAKFNDADPLAGTFVYTGRGYDNPQASEVAKLLHQAQIEVRKVARSQRHLSRGISDGTMS